mgnify:CR=1 FL=1|tara:strand:+ start:13760 stop:14101 length:342 start_codon:yes stop_codon:yes gene_type:complete
MVDKKTIAIGGEMRPIHYGFAALGEWCDITNTPLQELGSLGQNISLSSAIQLIYCGLKHGARRNKESFKFTADDVADWIDDEGMGVFNEAMEIFGGSLAKLNPSEKKKKEKKK